MIKRIERTDGTRWQVYGKRAGRKVYVGTYDSKREALEVDEEHRVTQRKIEAGELPPDLDMKRTLRQATDEWLTSLENRNSRSHGGYSERMRMYVLPHLGDTP
ncbi:MAG TPA: hypothetical protein VHU61_05770 [Solirubrobacteraceae bacterium]|jgi:hypothetical protein|nr:hypothetical protein [Solirubrobacteraceae bacterium]